MASKTSIIEEIELKKALSLFPTGIAALAAEVEKERHVLIVGSFSVGVSLEPPLVSFAVQKTSSTWPLLKQAKMIGVSILSGQQSQYCRQLAGKDKAARWNSVPVSLIESGALILDDSTVSFECSVHSEFPAGDHDVILLKIENLKMSEDIKPLVFHRSAFKTLEGC